MEIGRMWTKARLIAALAALSSCDLGLADDECFADEDCGGDSICVGAQTCPEDGEYCYGGDPGACVSLADEGEACLHDGRDRVAITGAGVKEGPYCAGALVCNKAEDPPRCREPLANGAPCVDDVACESWRCRAPAPPNPRRVCQ